MLNTGYTYRFGLKLKLFWIACQIPFQEEFCGAHADFRRGLGAPFYPVIELSTSRPAPSKA